MSHPAAKKYPVEILVNEDGSESVKMDSTVCLQIGEEPAFRGARMSALAVEYLKRAAVEDPHADAFEIDTKKDMFLATILPNSTTDEQRQGIIHELRAEGINAEIKEIKRKIE